MTNEDDVIWTIATGYYPEMAAGIKYKKRQPGSGQVGNKYISKRGYTDSSVTRQQSKDPKKGQTWTDAALEMAKAGAKGGKAAGSLEGKKLFQEATYTDKKTQAVQTYWKFRGGSEHYKLHGDQVWYMAGTRPRDSNVFQEFINDQATSNSPQFANVYSHQKKELAAEAIKLAEEMFDFAVEDVERELNAGSGKERSAEEIGYKEGDFEYMSHSAALEKYPHLAGQLQSSSKLSKANEVDMVKINTSGKNATIEFAHDVSEMDILQKGQHGITRVPEELKAAIGEAMGEGAGTTQIMQIKEAVIKMYQNAIKKDYNPTIKKMKKVAEIGGKSGKGDVGDKKWDDVLKAINKKANPKTAKRRDKVGTQTIGKVLGQNTWKVGFNKMNQKSAKQTSIQYVAHIMGSMNEAMQMGFKQSHRVFDLPDSGKSIYATVPMEVDQKTWLFKPEVVKDTDVFSAHGASMGGKLNASINIADNSLTHSKTQKWAYTMCKVTGMTTSATGRGQCAANMGIVKGARHATTVTIPDTKNIINMLMKRAGTLTPDLTDILDKTPLSRRTYGMKGGKLQKMSPSKQPMFWALPYIGAVQSDFEE